VALKGGSIAGQWDDLAVENATRNGAQLKWECNDTGHKRQYWMEFNVVSPGNAKLTYEVKGVTNEYNGWVAASGAPSRMPHGLPDPTTRCRPSEPVCRGLWPKSVVRPPERRM
jgi:hypothetical protein